jgi:hypothetical protein
MDKIIYKPLPEEYKNSGYIFKQIFRGDFVAIYEAKDDPSNIYEIFKIKCVKEQKLPNGTIMPAREKLPSKEDFGDWAWCPVSIKSAVNRALYYETSEHNINILKKFLV